METIKFFKTFFLSIVSFVFCSTSAFSQILNVKDLVYLQKKESHYIKDFMKCKKWELMGEHKGDMVWMHKDDRLALYKAGASEQKFVYMTRDEERYKAFRALAHIDYEFFIATTNDDGGTVSVYENNGVIITFFLTPESIYMIEVFNDTYLDPHFWKLYQFHLSNK